MSKTQLKKELENFSKEQLAELLLEMYSARKDVKAYLEFYLNPDSAKLFDKYVAQIEKEFRKVKWGYSKARISVIKKEIKEFESFSPDIDYRFKIYRYVITSAIYYEHYYRFADSLFNGLTFLTVAYLDYADKNMMLDRELKALDSIIDRSPLITRRMHELFKSIINGYLEENAGLSIKK